MVNHILKLTHNFKVNDVYADNGLFISYPTGGGGGGIEVTMDSVHGQTCDTLHLNHKLNFFL